MRFLVSLSLKLGKWMNVNFDKQCKLAVKNVADKLDNCLKGIITSALPERRYFNINNFMPILCSKMKQVTNPFIRSFLISYIQILNSIPNIELFEYLPNFIESLFLMLGDGSRIVREAAQKQLIDFKQEIDVYTRRNFYREEQQQVIHGQIIEILINICNGQSTASHSNISKLYALKWIQEYLRIFVEQLSGQYDPRDRTGFSIFLQFKKKILLSLKGFSQLRISNIEVNQESALKAIILQKFSYILEPILSLLSNEDQLIKEIALQINNKMLGIMDKLKNTNIEFVNVMPTVQHMFNEKNTGTAQNALIWMRHLLQIYSDKLLPSINEILSDVGASIIIISQLIERLKDADRSVAQNVMDILKSISHEQYFDLVIEKLLNVFYSNRELLQKNSEVILKDLITIWSPEHIYTSISIKLIQKYVFYDLDFVIQVIQILDFLLATDKGLLSMRKCLRRGKPELKDERQKLFDILYTTFCFNPVSTLNNMNFPIIQFSACITQICDQFSSEQEVESELIVQVTRLINMLESPSFAYLRLELLENDKHPYLLKSLQGLMMIIPQTECYKKLKHRIKNIGPNIISKHQLFDQQQLFFNLFMRQLFPIDVHQYLDKFLNVSEQIINLRQEAKEKEI